MSEKSICRKCFHSYVCEQFNENKDMNNKKCHFANDHFVSTEDVVPKSDVEGIVAIRLRMQQRKDAKHDYALGVLDDLLTKAYKENRRLQDDNQFLQDRRFKELSEVRREVAKEIFEEIDGIIDYDNFPIAHRKLVSEFAELKKKYTESEGKEC